MVNRVSSSFPKKMATNQNCLCLKKITDEVIVVLVHECSQQFIAHRNARIHTRSFELLTRNDGAYYTSN